MENLISFCWIANAHDQFDRHVHRQFERLLAPLYRSSHGPNIANADHHAIRAHLHAIEGKLLFGKSGASPRQSARYWFLAARWYVAFRDYQAASEAYELCYRAVDPCDSLAVYVIHAYWAPVATFTGCQAQAQRCHDVLCSLTEPLAQQYNLARQANEDNLLYLAAIDYRLHLSRV